MAGRPRRRRHEALARGGKALIYMGGAFFLHNSPVQYMCGPVDGVDILDVQGTYNGIRGHIWDSPVCVPASLDMLSCCIHCPNPPGHGAVTIHVMSNVWPAFLGILGGEVGGFWLSPGLVHRQRQITSFLFCQLFPGIDRGTYGRKRVPKRCPTHIYLLAALVLVTQPLEDFTPQLNTYVPTSNDAYAYL